LYCFSYRLILAFTRLRRGLSVCVNGCIELSDCYRHRFLTGKTTAATSESAPGAYTSCSQWGVLLGILEQATGRLVPIYYVRMLRYEHGVFLTRLGKATPPAQQVKYVIQIGCIPPPALVHPTYHTHVLFAPRV
jgi:hypothetical protein